jgi:hypothetical protein
MAHSPRSQRRLGWPDNDQEIERSQCNRTAKEGGGPAGSVGAPFGSVAGATRFAADGRAERLERHALGASRFPAGEDVQSPNLFLARRCEPHGTFWGRQIPLLRSGLFELGPRQVPGAGMRLQRQSFRKGKTVLGPRCFSNFVGLRCVSFPVASPNLRTWATKPLRAGPSAMWMRPLKLMRSKAGHTAMTNLVKIGDEAKPRLPGVLLGEAACPSQSGRENSVGSHPLCLRLSRVRISRGGSSTIRLRQSNLLVFTSINIGVLSPTRSFAPRATRRES